jgi:hypothetical protein
VREKEAVPLAEAFEMHLPKAIEILLRELRRRTD